jgi:hypothetical protein
LVAHKFTLLDNCRMAGESKARLVMAATEAGPAQGFNVRLEGVTLADLIQMKCWSGARECLRISSEGRLGALQFSNGQLTHALAPDLVGESAVFELLLWKTGDCEPCLSSLPPRAAVRRSWQSLLLDAAKTLDEEAAASDAPLSAEVTDLDNPTSPSSSRVVSLRMSEGGQILESVGAAKELASTATYALHMANHIGVAFGFDGFSGCELRNGELRTVLVVEENGDVSAYQSDSEADVAHARARAGI